MCFSCVFVSVPLFTEEKTFPHRSKGFVYLSMNTVRGLYLSSPPHAMLSPSPNPFLCAERGLPKSQHAPGNTTIMLPHHVCAEQYQKSCFRKLATGVMVFNDSCRIVVDVFYVSYFGMGKYNFRSNRLIG